MMAAPSTSDAGHTIRVLPDALANQIAAGEVVERPAAAVKELVENAIDAEATIITVDLEEGGQNLIRVVDDGFGMTDGDARLCTQRHATSKIGNVDDLTHVLSLGFRGEALPSIASVSRFTLITRQSETPVATRIDIEGGNAPVRSEVSAPAGTQIEVRDLFFNVPARLKFLKRPATELGYVKRMLNAMALGYPYIHFRLSHQGKRVLDYPATRRLEERMFQVLGKSISRGLHRIMSDGDVRVEGAISEPGVTRGNQMGITTFINGRLIRDRVINHALVSAYGDMLPAGRYPYAVLYIYLKPESLDVNVHPTKAEVRFESPGFIHQAIASACASTLSATPWILVPREATASPERQAFRPVHRPYPLPEAGFLPNPPPAPRPETRDPTPATPSPGVIYIGQSSAGHAIYETNQTLHVIDWTTAQRTIVQAKLAAHDGTGRDLMFPVTLELDAGTHETLSEHLTPFINLGIGIEPFGGRTWQVTALPPFLGDCDPNRLVRAGCASLRANRRVDRKQMLIEAIAGAAISSQDQPMGEDEAARIVREYAAIADTDKSSPLGIPFTELPGESGNDR